VSAGKLVPMLTTTSVVMNMVDGVALITIIFVLVDDWYQEYGYKLVPWTSGANPTFSYSEVLTLFLAIDYFRYSG
jgi:hypothetical protein